MPTDHRIERLRRQIIARADAAGQDGWTDIPVAPAIRADGLLRVPRGAFEQWAVHLSRGGHLAQPWEPVSPVGVKQGADDPYHTDWMLGAGLAPGDMRHNGGNPHWEALSAAAYAARGKVERRLLGFTCSVLLPGPDIEGRVLKPTAPGEVDWDATGGRSPVLVLRDASPDWFADVLRALDEGGAVIVERGGSMAHLVTEVRAHGKGPIVRMPDAGKLYPDDGVVEISAASGSIRLVEQERVIDTAILQGAWQQDEPEDPAVPWTPPPANGSFGLRLHAGGPIPFNHLGFMEPCGKADGRDFTARASLHTNSMSYDAPAMLAVHICPRDRKSKTMTVVTTLRIWDRDDIYRAIRDALYLAVPAEHPDSPETRAADEARKAQEHAWWLRGHGNLDNTELVERAKRDLRDRAALRAECGEDFIDADEEALDALESYRHGFRHFDIEFAIRGLSVKTLDLEMELEAPADSAGSPRPRIGR